MDYVSTAQHEAAFLHESRESRESSAEPYGEKQLHVMSRDTVSFRHSVYESYKETSGNVDSHGSQGKSDAENILYGSGNEISAYTSKKAAGALHGTGELTKLLGEPPMGGITLYPVDGADGKRGIRFLFPDFEGETTLEISIDGGKTWPYSVADSEEEYYLRLIAGTYDVYVRHGEGRDSVPMGEIMIK